MYDLLKKIAKALADKFDIPEDKVLKLLQYYFYPYEDKPEDKFSKDLDLKDILKGFKL